MTAVARLVAPVALALGIILGVSATSFVDAGTSAAGGLADPGTPLTDQALLDVSALMAASAAVAPAPRARSFAMAQAGDSLPRVRPGKEDERGCSSLSVRRGSKVLLRIPSHAAGCSTNRLKIRIGGYLYFDWGVTRRKGDERWRRNDLWVTDGTRRGTVKVTTLRSGTRREESCAHRWAWVGGMSIAAAQWCWNPRTGASIDGRIRIVTRGQTMRFSPVPDMQRFSVAGKRMVTTGADAYGRELWIHDSQMVRLDLRPGPKSSNPRNFHDHGPRKVRFIANDGTGKALWVTDGTAAGTHKVR